ncbi:MAG: hypothetical protein UW69_C0059G0001 [Microgenomates group bacterium GW2011_GWA2_44_7]|nr:MAG: hypothetical protein UW69_C0059G0001 [Microgenomates group bacterium GW2011_GWA2_44_7]KKT77703.1 MAG: hypothetical protein UW73_C0014G0026 [Microgenomates group bacterium GW2011_GWB1_44_8]
MRIWFLMMSLFVGLVVLFLSLYSITQQNRLKVLGNTCPDILIPSGCQYGAERRQDEKGCIIFVCSRPVNK